MEKCGESYAKLAKKIDEDSRQGQMHCEKHLFFSFHITTLQRKCMHTQSRNWFTHHKHSGSHFTVE